LFLVFLSHFDYPMTRADMYAYMEQNHMVVWAEAPGVIVFLTEPREAHVTGRLLPAYGLRTMERSFLFDRYRSSGVRFHPQAERLGGVVRGTWNYFYVEANQNPEGPVDPVERLTFIPSNIRRFGFWTIVSILGFAIIMIQFGYRAFRRLSQETPQ